MLISGVYAGWIGRAVRSVDPNLANQEDAAGRLLTRLPFWMLVVFAACLATIVATSGDALQDCVLTTPRLIGRTELPHLRPARFARQQR
ncbi:hypothetical protein [Streptomyces yanii]|uniref:hypothetical protein n=1 Tax=Streptomyces yanii TaxID=78510 RepID=UPI0031ED33D6